MDGNIPFPFENIANGIHAAGRIQKVLNATLHENRKSAIFPSDISKIYEIMDIISDFFPETHKDRFKNTVNIGKTYSNTFNNLKTHMKTRAEKKFRSDDIVKTLNIITPLFDNRNKMVIDNIVKLYHSLNHK